jgi:tetratricopeptide (TPR) repeat protein
VSQVHKTVFISYRRTDKGTARAVYQALTSRGYDCFLDYQSINSGDWLATILTQVAARAHFVLILSPTTLERCKNPDDILRQEIEQAVRQTRNIVTLLFDNVDISKMGDYLVSDELKRLPKYNALRVPDDFFEEAMERLINRYLNIPLDLVIHPTPTSHQAALQQNQQQVVAMPTPSKLKPSAADWLARGQQAFDNQSYDLALEFFSHAIDTDPHFALAYAWRGRCYVRQKNYEQGFLEINQAIQLNPDESFSYLVRGFIYTSKGDFDRAIEDYSQAIRLTPDDAEAYNNRGSLYHRYKQDYNRAIQDYSQSIRLQPDYRLAYTNRAAAYAEQRDGRAIADYSQAIHLKPDDPIAYYDRGLAHARQRNHDHAITDYSQAIRLKPDFAEAYYYRGAIYQMIKKNYRLAIADYSQAIHLKPDFADAYLSRAVFYHYIKQDYERAITDYEAVLRIDPHDKLAKTNLSLAKQKRVK